MKRLIGALAVAAILFTTGCGGDDDSFPEDEFVRQVTANGVTEDVARCTYDGIRDDADIMAELRRTGGPNDQISDAAARTMSRTIAACLLGLELDEDGQPISAVTTTTASPSKSTTTEPAGESRATTTARDGATSETGRTTTTRASDRTTTSLGTRSGN